jgi:hypothetical protein
MVSYKSTRSVMDADQMGEAKNTYTILFRKSDWKSLGIRNCRFQNNVKM